MPLDDRGFERINPDIAGRPSSFAATRSSFSGHARSEACVLTLKNKSHSVTSQDHRSRGRGQGRDHHAGRRGRRLDPLRHEGKLKYCYNFFGIDYFFAVAERPIPAGKHQVRMEFKYDGGGLAKGGDVTLYYDGEAVGKGRVERSQPMGYSADEACDVGSDTGSPASPDYGPSGNSFTGAIEWVQIDIGDDDHNHLITPEQRFKIAMARQ